MRSTREDEWRQRPKTDLMISTTNSSTIVTSRIIIHRVFWSCRRSWYISSSVLSFSSIVRCQSCRWNRAPIALVDARQVPVAEELGDVAQLILEARQVDADLAKLALSLASAANAATSDRDSCARRRRRGCGRRLPARRVADSPAP